MTVCIGALAADSKAIVCVADKALTYGEYIQWDADSTKMIPLTPGGTMLMFSGNEEGCSRVLGNILETEEEIGAGKTHTRVWLETRYKEALEELIQLNFLNPRLLTRAQYTAAITAGELNDYMKALAAEHIDKYDTNCTLLVCGFDFFADADSQSPEAPFLFMVSHPGIAVDMTRTGFHAIGSGWDRAVSRMLWNDFKRTHPLERVLYDAFDSKASAEMSIGVGFEWDASIVVEKHGPREVPKDIKELIERAWAQENRSPFEEYNKDEDIPPPPKKWKEQLKEYCDSIMR